jgi:hypothetical protein
VEALLAAGLAVVQLEDPGAALLEEVPAVEGLLEEVLAVVQPGDPVEEVLVAVVQLVDPGEALLAAGLAVEQLQG